MGDARAARPTNAGQAAVGIVQQFKPGLRRLLVAKARHLRLRAFVVPQHGAIDDQLAVGIEQNRAVHLPAGTDGGDTRPVFGVARVQLLRTLANALPPQRRRLFRPTGLRRDLFILALREARIFPVLATSLARVLPVPISRVRSKSFIVITPVADGAGHLQKRALGSRRI